MKRKEKKKCKTEKYNIEIACWNSFAPHSTALHVSHTHGVCEFRKFSRCKFFLRFAHYRHTVTHLISAHTHISHAAALIIIESDIKYTIEIQTQLTHTQHISSRTQHTFYLWWESFDSQLAEKRKKKITIYAQRQSMWTWWKMQRLVAWKTFLIISIMIWTINKFNSKLNLNKKKWKIEKEKKRKTHETETSFSHTEEYRRLGRIGCMHLHANPINIQTHTYEYVEREHCSVNAFIISFPRKFSKVLPH